MYACLHTVSKLLKCVTQTSAYFQILENYEWKFLKIKNMSKYAIKIFKFKIQTSQNKFESNQIYYIYFQNRYANTSSLEHHNINYIML